MAGPFRTPVDIANRALQLLRRPAIYSFDDKTVESRETRDVYDRLRLYELRRATWRFSTRRVVLRAINTTTMLVVPAAWDQASTYLAGDIVAFQNQIWLANRATLADIPGAVPASGALVWDSYFGPMTADLWSSPIEPALSQNQGSVQPTSYYVGELVFKTAGDGSYTTYRSLTNNNVFDPTGVDSWLDDTVYSSGQVVAYQGTNYQALTSLNFNHPPSTSPSQWTTTITSPLVSNSWRPILSVGSHDTAMAGTTLVPMNIEYPLGVGPTRDSRTRNAYRLPGGFLRKAPTDPKADLYPFLGGPSGNWMEDYVFESNFIVSRLSNPIMLRFIADVQSVIEFDAMFAEGLATRMAIELAPRLADAEHMATIMASSREEYARTITEARTVNGIETGPVSPSEDDFITVRV